MSIIRVKLDEADSQRLMSLENQIAELTNQITMLTNNEKPAERFLEMKEVEEIVGFGKKWIYAEIKKNKFPPPVKLYTSSRWRLSEVMKWIESQKPDDKIQ